MLSHSSLGLSFSVSICVNPSVSSSLLFFEVLIGIKVKTKTLQSGGTLSYFMLTLKTLPGATEAFSILSSPVPVVGLVPWVHVFY